MIIVYFYNMSASIEKLKIDKALAAVAKTVSRRAKKHNQPVLVLEKGKVKEIYPYKKEK